MTPKNSQVPLSPGRIPVSPLAAISTHGFMQMTGMRAEVDGCKFEDVTSDFLNNVWTHGNSDRFKNDVLVR